jgi:hypothetical protein
VEPALISRVNEEAGDMKKGGDVKRLRVLLAFLALIGLGSCGGGGGDGGGSGQTAAGTWDQMVWDQSNWQ